MIEVNKSTVIDEKMIKESQITEEKRMQYAIVAIARQIMKVIIWKVKELDMVWSYFLDSLRDIWDSQEEDRYESAYEILFSILMRLRQWSITQNSEQGKKNMKDKNRGRRYATRYENLLPLNLFT